LRAESRDPTTHGLALGQRRHWRNGGVGAGLVEDVLGQLTSLDPIVVGAGDDARRRGIRARCRAQRFVASGYQGLVIIWSHTAIRRGVSAQYGAVGHVQRWRPRAPGEQLMSAA
jgi:hypothetical protein